MLRDSATLTLMSLAAVFFATSAIVIVINSSIGVYNSNSLPCLVTTTNPNDISLNTYAYALY